MVVVFAKSRLISIDTITPVLMYLYHKSESKSKSIVIVPDYKTFKAVNNNIVIKDALNECSYIILWGGFTKNKILRKLSIIGLILRLFFYGLSGSKFIHFKALDVYPLNILGFLFKRNVFLMQSNAYQMKHKSVRYKIGKAILEKVKPVGKNIIYFNSDMMADRCSTKNVKKSYHLCPPRESKVWVEYIKNISNVYFQKEHPEVVKNNMFCVYILGGSNTNYNLEGEDAYKRLFITTIGILSRCLNNVVLLVKPHPTIEDISFFEDEIRKYNNIEITYLHPSILSRNAVFMISNTFTTVFNDAKLQNIKTIEFTHYKDEVLRLTKGESLGGSKVDYFINNKPGELLKTVEKLLSMKGSDDNDITIPRSDYTCNTSDIDKLIFDLNH
jgi:hypothetical protein